MAIFGANGIRDAMKRTYEKHYELARQGKIPASSDDPHYAGLFGALGSRYRLLGKFSEQAVFLEVMPFWKLDPSVGKEALAEYVVFMESPKDCNQEWLSSQIKEGLRRFGAADKETSDGMLMMVEMNRIRWRELA
jgi:hypothetical protein